jgi:uncharacterized repeat protein (TIGR03803 family)
MKNHGLFGIASIVAVFCVATAIASPAKTFNVVANFNGKNGDVPNGPLVQGATGNFYGTTQNGGAHNSNQYCTGYGCGTVFEVTPTGKLTTIYNFCSQKNCADGAMPTALVLGANGNFYGTTASGGANNVDICQGSGCGTFFEITPAGKLTTLHSFCAQQTCADGSAFTLVQATNGNFYGAGGGGNRNGDAGCPTGCGTIVEITPEGKLTTVYSFCPGTSCTDGEFPMSVMQASNGNFYGVTLYGGANGWGAVFKLTPAGKLTVLYSFCKAANCADGEQPSGMLTQGTNGNFYGTTRGGGANDNSLCYGGPGCGTAYKLTPTGKLTTLYNFCSQTNCTDGSNPISGLIQDTDGNFYGTSSFGGTAFAMCFSIGCGTAFAMTPTGKLNTLYNFCSRTNCTDGANPSAALIQATNGAFYGLTGKGGADFTGCIAGGGCGDVFSLSVGLGPFVETNPTSGKVGRAVTILGKNLSGATSVSLNGTAATFTIISGTEIKTTVPTGATTGSVEVTTPSKTLKSNVVFRVTK